jgi:hypothetical protein
MNLRFNMIANPRIAQDHQWTQLTDDPLSQGTRRKNARHEQFGKFFLIQEGSPVFPPMIGFVHRLRKIAEPWRKRLPSISLNWGARLG